MKIQRGHESPVPWCKDFTSVHSLLFLGQEISLRLTSCLSYLENGTVHHWEYSLQNPAMNGHVDKIMAVISSV